MAIVGVVQDGGALCHSPWRYTASFNLDVKEAHVRKVGLCRIIVNIFEVESHARNAFVKLESSNEMQVGRLISSVLMESH